MVHLRCAAHLHRPRGVCLYNLLMLPAGFRLDGEGDGCRLLLAGRVIGRAHPANERGTCRVCLHECNAELMRYRFFDDMEQGRRYITAWAIKWEAELRELYSGDAPGLWRC